MAASPFVRPSRSACPTRPLFDFVLPKRCPVCARPGPAPCPRCIAGLIREPLVAVPVGLDACWAAMAYDVAGQRIVSSLKYRNARSLVIWLGEQLAEAAIDLDLDVVTWAPTTAAHRRRRGFDQAELLARQTGRYSGLAVRPTLVRLPGPSQTGRSLAERLEGPHFDLRRGASKVCAGRSIGLVDDVVTSGATLRAAARLLRVAGASRVVGLAAARTPRSRGS